MNTLAARGLVWAARAALGPAALVSAQTTTAVRMGTVLDEQRGVLPGAAVTVRDTETGIVSTAVTDERGRYRIPALRASIYEVRVELSGFATIVQSGVALAIAQEATIDFTLRVAQIEESITVTGESPLVETTKAAVERVITRQDVDSLPLIGRSFSSLTSLAAGVSGSSIGGQLSYSNTQMVDGVANTGVWTPTAATSWDRPRMWI